MKFIVAAYGWLVGIIKSQPHTLRKLEKRTQSEKNAPRKIGKVSFELSPPLVVFMRHSDICILYLSKRGRKCFVFDFEKKVISVLYQKYCLAYRTIVLLLVAIKVWRNNIRFISILSVKTSQDNLFSLDKSQRKTNTICARIEIN